MEKYKDSDVELMSILLKLQEQTSPIRMSIGYTAGGTVRQGIILYEAAPKVIETLIEKGYTCDLNGCGMRVAIEWFMVFASFIAAFIVALVSMDGWERVTELAEKLIRKK